MFPLWTLVVLLLCYLIGSIPSGMILAHRLKGVDLRLYGSGNVGATNAFRALGLAGGVLVLVADLLKGFLAVKLAFFAMVPDFLAHVTTVACGLAAIAGHNWSIFMRFRGGKGVATSFGVLLGLTPLVAAMAGLLWVAVLALSRYSSLASLAALLSVPVLMIVYHDPPVYIAFGVLAAAFALYRHRGNIQRLIQGKELALGERADRKE
ncbi:MAG: glycerol-3-phosphate 1-O-acyltransferase PlsY [Candidatus Xenobium sp.]|jgi:glycerol-3-phosphate acyltransferase PlsY|nr:glycerol-3-phosphate 1-O-acyltransferase PlsY [Burkholderiales bacterium]